MDEKFTLLIYKKLKGTISTDEFEILSSWLLEKEENLSYFQELSNAWDLQSTPNDVTAAEWKKLAARLEIDADNHKVVQMQPSNEKQSFLKIAAVALIFLGSVFALQQFLKADKFETIASNNSPLETTLPDGSTVTLNANSSIKYLKKFTNNRTINLNGEAYFEVEKFEGKPFTVNGENYHVTVLGTKFNVNSEKVVVTEGKVAVKEKVSNTAIQLIENEQAFLADKNILIKQKADRSHIFLFADEIAFNDATIFEIAKRLQKESGLQISLNDAIKNCKLTGNYTKENIADVLKDIESVFNFKVAEVSEGNWQIDGEGCP